MSTQHNRFLTAFAEHYLQYSEMTLKRLCRQFDAELAIPLDEKEMKEEFQWPKPAGVVNSQEAGGSFVKHQLVRDQSKVVQEGNQRETSKTRWDSYLDRSPEPADLSQAMKPGSEDPILGFQGPQ